MSLVSFDYYPLKRETRMSGIWWTWGSFLVISEGTIPTIWNNPGEPSWRPQFWLHIRLKAMEQMFPLLRLPALKTSSCLPVCLSVFGFTHQAMLLFPAPGRFSLGSSPGPWFLLWDIFYNHILIWRGTQKRWDRGVRTNFIFSLFLPLSPLPCSLSLPFVLSQVSCSSGWLQTYCAAEDNLELPILLLLSAEPPHLFSTGDRTSGFVHAKQTLYQLSHIPRPDFLPLVFTLKAHVQHTCHDTCLFPSLQVKLLPFDSNWSNLTIEIDFQVSWLESAPTEDVHSASHWAEFRHVERSEMFPLLLSPPAQSTRQRQSMRAGRQTEPT